MEMRLVLNVIVLIIILFTLHSEGTYICTYQSTQNSTVYGDNINGSGQSFPSPDTCLAFCCNTPNCAAVTWVSSWGGCYLKTLDTLTTNNVDTEIGTQLLIISNHQISTSCKRGVAYGGWLSNADFSSLMSNLPWYYEWSPAPDPVSATSNGNVEFVPMIWGGQGVMSALSSIPPLRTNYLLGFNEPNIGIQSNLTPQAAASLWPSLQVYADTHKLKLVSPAMNFCTGNCNVADPIAWLTQFFQACVNCRVDYIAMHSYTCEVKYLREQVNLYKIFQKPIWVTEFSCPGVQGSQPEAVQAYMIDALAYLDSDPDVFRYSWFSGRTTVVANVDLLLGNAQLSSLGNIYTSGYSCGAPVAAVKDSYAFVIFVIVIPIVVVGGYICYKKRHRIAEVF